MQDAQLVYDRQQESKKELKDMRDQYRDNLYQTDDYEEIKEQLKVLNEKKAKIEDKVKAQMGDKFFLKMDELKLSIKTDKEMLTDIAVSTLMKGETVEIKDVWDNQCEPKFSVDFRKKIGGSTL